jgi:3-hydroxy-5-phosphonooxypentane-2,4-dione thiolase
MDWGMKNRLSRIINPATNRCVMLAVDHGYFLGPTSGLECPAGMLEPLLPYADALMLNRGMLRTCIPPESSVPVMLRVSGGTSVLKDLSNEGVTVDFEDAIRLNVSGVALSIFVGEEYERQTLLSLSELVNLGESYGIPVLAVTAVGKSMGRDVRYLALASRIAAELGAHIVKTYYCKNFEKLTTSVPVPVVVAGGKKTTEMEALKMAYKAVDQGAVGVDMGRNIFQSDCPVGMIKAVSGVVHHGLKPKEAYDIYKSEKACGVTLKKAKKTATKPKAKAAKKTTKKTKK